MTNDLGNSLTPIDPLTGKPGTPKPVLDPYNLYFTADGRRAIVVAEAHRLLDFRSPHTMKLRHRLPVPQCPGVDHMDYTADGRTALVSCEFGGRMIVVDLVHERVLQHDPAARRARCRRTSSSHPTGGRSTSPTWPPTASGRSTPTPGRSSASSRRAAAPTASTRAATRAGSTSRTAARASISLISFATRRPVQKWRIPGGGSPDMGGVSADGRVLWLSGRYNAEVYAIDTRTGKLRHRIPVGSGPHGMAVWPQPGRYSIGHTGILR